MSYRTIKRVLGETSLERKCRFLFGTCLLLLIAGAFIGVDQIAEKLIRTNRGQVQPSLRERCRGLAEMRLLAMHFEAWVAEGTEQEQVELQVKHIKRLSAALIQEKYEWQILTLKESPPDKARHPITHAEEVAMQNLQIGRASCRERV